MAFSLTNRPEDPSDLIPPTTLPFAPCPAQPPNLSALPRNRLFINNSRGTIHIPASFLSPPKSARPDKPIPIELTIINDSGTVVFEPRPHGLGTRLWTAACLLATL